MTYRSTLLHFRLMEQRLFQHVVTIDQARSKCGVRLHFLPFPAISHLTMHCPLADALSLELKAEKQNAHTSGPYGPISSVQFSPDGSRIVSGGIEDKTLKVWDAGTPARPIPHLAQT